MSFAPREAWYFICECLDSGAPIREVELRQPPGAVAYELIVSLGDRQLYIKLQLTGDRVLGRSFHYSTKEDTLDD
jgi:hypothetical protein